VNIKSKNLQHFSDFNITKIFNLFTASTQC